MGPKILSTTCLNTYLDADIESGSIWGYQSKTFLVYRSGPTLISFELLNNSKHYNIDEPNEINCNHSCNISALSSSSSMGYSLSGDLTGTLIVWRIVEDGILEPWFSNNSIFSTEVTFIESYQYSSNIHNFYSCDISGNIYLIELNTMKSSIVTNFHICSGTFGFLHPSHISLESNINVNRMRICSKFSASCIEISFDNKVKILFNSIQQFYGDGHRNLIKCATIIKPLNMILSVSWEGIIYFWDFRVGNLIGTYYKHEDKEIISIAAAYLGRNLATISYGTNNGNTHNLNLRLPNDVSDDNSTNTKSFELFQVLDREIESFDKDAILNSTSDNITFDNNNEQYYLPLPVTDIIYSTRAQYIAYCYIRCKLVIHDRIKNLPISSIDINEYIVSINSIFEADENAEEDKLIIVIIGSKIIRVLDALKREYIFKIDSFPTNIDLTHSILWYDKASIKGIYTSKKLSINMFQFDNSQEILSTNSILENFGDLNGSLSDKIIQGLNLLNVNNAILLISWTLRYFLTLQFSTGN